MKVVFFAGTTGFNKSKFLEGFREYYLEKDEYARTGTESEAHVKLVNFEDKLVEVSGSETIDAFLKRDSWREKAEYVEQTFVRIGREIMQRNHEIVFLDIHLSYYRNSMFFPPLLKDNFEQVTKQIDDASASSNIRVITLIDDIFVVWKTIISREDMYPDTQLRLREISAWRSLEILQSESVASNLMNPNSQQITSYLFAIRHPLESLYNLIERPKPRVGYLSFPITATRDIPEHVREINQFRNEATKIAHANKGLFLDPVMIDEMLLDLALKKQGETDYIELKKDERWPIDPSPLIDDSQLWPIKIPTNQIKEVKNDISNNVTARDYKLIDCSKMVAAYRPSLGGKESTGVKAELGYAVQLGKLPLTYIPEAANREEDYRPFGLKVETVSDRDRFLSKIKTRLTQ